MRPASTTPNQTVHLFSSDCTLSCQLVTSKFNCTKTEWMIYTVFCRHATKFARTSTHSWINCGWAEIDPRNGGDKCVRCGRVKRFKLLFGIRPPNTSLPINRMRRSHSWANSTHTHIAWARVVRVVRDCERIIARWCFCAPGKRCKA